MRARGKHNCTASRKVVLMSILTASTPSQSESRSRTPATSSHLSSSTDFQDFAGSQITQDGVVAVSLAAREFVNAQILWRRQWPALFQAQSALGELGAGHGL